MKKCPSGPFYASLFAINPTLPACSISIFSALLRSAKAPTWTAHPGSFKSPWTKAVYGVPVFAAPPGAGWHQGAPSGAAGPSFSPGVRFFVYKPGVFCARIPKVDGKSLNGLVRKSQSRVKVAQEPRHCSSKSVTSTYFAWSSSGGVSSPSGLFGVRMTSCLSVMPKKFFARKMYVTCGILP